MQARVSVAAAHRPTVGPKQRPGLFIHFVSVCYVSLGKKCAGSEHGHQRWSCVNIIYWLIFVFCSVNIWTRCTKSETYYTLALISFSSISSPPPPPPCVFASLSRSLLSLHQLLLFQSQSGESSHHLPPPHSLHGQRQKAWFARWILHPSLHARP